MPEGLDCDSGKCDSLDTTLEKGFRNIVSGAFFFARFHVLQVLIVS
jgi:hypothetical protein